MKRLTLIFSVIALFLVNSIAFAHSDSDHSPNSNTATDWQDRMDSGTTGNWRQHHLHFVDDELPNRHPSGPDQPSWGLVSETPSPEAPNDDPPSDAYNHPHTLLHRDVNGEYHSHYGSHTHTGHRDHGHNSSEFIGLFGHINHGNMETSDPPDDSPLPLDDSPPVDNSPQSSQPDPIPAPIKSPAPINPPADGGRFSGGGVMPIATTPRTSSGIVEILPPVNTPRVSVILAPTTLILTDESEVSEPVEKPKLKRKRLLPIPRAPNIPEMLPKRCRLLKFQLPKIDIVRVEVFQKPRRVHVTVRHYVKKTISLHCYMLEFTDSEGKFIYRKEARSYRNNGRAWLRYKPEQYEKFGYTQSEFILTSKWIVDKYDMRKKFGVEFGLNFRIYAKNVPYYQPEEGHVLILRAPTDLDKDKMLDVVGQFPKDEDAPAAPSLIKPKMTTLWATLKK